MNVRPRTEKAVGKWLVDLREAADLSQAKIAGDAEMQQRTLRRWETAGVPTQIIHFLHLLDAVGVEIVTPGSSPQSAVEPSADDDLLDRALEEIGAVLERLVTRVSERVPQPDAASSRRKKS